MLFLHILVKHTFAAQPIQICFLIRTVNNTYITWSLMTESQITGKLFNSLSMLTTKKNIQTLYYCPLSWRHHQMETFSTLLALCAGTSSVTCEFHTQRPVMLSFDVFLDLRLNKHSWGWWFETSSGSLWHHCYVMEIPWWPVNFSHKGAVIWKAFTCHDIIMNVFVKQPIRWED